jgi:hypothetical protein
MPGYGVATEPDGMLPWSFALERLVSSHDYWLATVWPDGGPHIMPVWGAWFRDVDRDRRIWATRRLARSDLTPNPPAPARVILTGFAMEIRRDKQGRSCPISWSGGRT